MEQPAELPTTVFEQFAHGDLDAFESLFRQFQGEVYRWTVRIVRDHGIAEDLTVETFWRIHRAHARFDPKRSFGAWARRIATNTALDYLKRSRRETELPEDLAAAALPDPGIQQDVRERVGKAFRRLPAKLRVAATLALIEEEPYHEIAEALGISVGAVKLRVFRAVRLLRKQLKHLGVEP
jgi:RNA polymerase sigma-70 factor (ECF subfamily)